MSKIIANRADIVAIADAVRSKAGVSGQMTLEEIATEIESIEAGGSEIQKASVTLSFPMDAMAIFETYDDELKVLKPAMLCMYGINMNNQQPFSNSAAIVGGLAYVVFPHNKYTWNVVITGNLEVVQNQKYFVAIRVLGDGTATITKA